MSPEPTIRSSADDYAPGSLVIIIGEGWQPDEAIDLFVDDLEDKGWQRQDAVVADDAGGFTYSFRLPTWFVAVYVVTATGETSGEAVAEFTDAIGTGDTTDGDNGWFPSAEVTLATPATSAGRLLLANVAIVDLGSGVVCAPGGWSSVGATVASGVSVHSYYRVVSGGEPASYTWQFRDTAAHCGSNQGTIATGATGAIVSYAGIDTASPIRAFAGAAGSGSSFVAPDVSGAGSGDTVVRHFGSARATGISTASASSNGIAHSQVYATNRGSFLAPAIAAADADLPAGGSTGTLSASGGNGGWSAQTIVLRSAVQTLTLTIPDDTATFGTNLTPDGDSSDSTDTITVTTGNRGACYYWTGTVRIESTTPYRIEVTGVAPRPKRLDLHSAEPVGYAACSSGEPVDGHMFRNASPRGTWQGGQTPTSGRDHPVGLGLDVRWKDNPNPALGDATVTFTAIAE